MIGIELAFKIFSVGILILITLGVCIILLECVVRLYAIHKRKNQ